MLLPLLYMYVLIFIQSSYIFSGNKYVLKMRVIDHIFDEFVVDHLSLKIILPEGCT